NVVHANAPPAVSASTARIAASTNGQRRRRRGPAATGAGAAPGTNDGSTPDAGGNCVGSRSITVTSFEPDVAPASGKRSGLGSSSAAASRPTTNSPASGRSPGSSRPARARTPRSGPSSAGTSTAVSTRAINVAMVVSAAKGTRPVTASISTSAREYTSPLPEAGSPRACSGHAYRAVPSIAPE